jgi:hypothetical protein
MHETFWQLLQDPAHWEFELFLMAVFDLLLGGLLWPILRNKWRSHEKKHNLVSRDADARLYCEGSDYC